jgi:hypothetical protein
MLTVRHRDRVAFLRLLKEASRLQVLRQAGTVYQFRHSVLHERLATLGAEMP